MKITVLQKNNGRHYLSLHSIFNLLTMIFASYIFYVVSGRIIFFTVTSPNRSLTIHDRPLFSRVVSNQGDAYSMHTAEFISPVKGLYHFSFTLQTSTVETSCSLFHNGNYIAYVGTHANNHYVSATLSLYLYLDIGDTVDVRGCFNWRYVNTQTGSLFTGALVMSS